MGVVSFPPMKQTILAAALVSLLFLACKDKVRSQDSQPVAEVKPAATPGKTGDIIYDRANPKARALLTDPFFWSRDELTSPFGCAGGGETAKFYVKWRDTSKTANAVTLLEHSYTASLFPPFNWHETDARKIRLYLTSLMHSKVPYIQHLRESDEKLVKEQGGEKLSKAAYEAEVQKYMDVDGLSFLQAQDNGFVTICFMQFIMDGKVDADLQALTIAAVKRQMLPICLSKFNDEYKVTRKMLLQKILDAVNKMNL